MSSRRNQLLALMLALAPACALGQAPQQFVLIEGDLQKRANGVIALMGYMVTPDVTTGSLGISNNATGNPDFRMTTAGGGFTLRGREPVYLEGTLGYARYNPTFVASNGQVERSVSSDWTAYSASGGVGWDFPLRPHLVLRPIVNASYGRVESNVAIRQTGAGDELEFLTNGRLDSYGAGGSIMLDYEDYNPKREIDVELRYTNIRLNSAGNSSAAVQGSANAESVSFWSRYRAPSGLVLMERPFRYVLELAYSRFYGDLDGVLGFRDIVSLGTGLELDTSAREGAISRARLMARYKIGDNVTGWSIGLAVSF